MDIFNNEKKSKKNFMCTNKDDIVVHTLREKGSYGNEYYEPYDISIPAGSVFFVEKTDYYKHGPSFLITDIQTPERRLYTIDDEQSVTKNTTNINTVQCNIEFPFLEDVKGSFERYDFNSLESSYEMEEME